MPAKRLGMYNVHGSTLEIMMQTMDSGLAESVQLLDASEQLRGLLPAYSAVSLSQTSRTTEASAGACPIAWDEAKGRAEIQGLNNRLPVLPDFNQSMSSTLLSGVSPLPAFQVT
ncbi:unnamed protein product [Protopolystoma xenopodis]|uniref:Uncharacterized protein n=1 Tax=Protopolystoma xenopodis TaxID=117903 RepID=A0A3S5FDA0_9PLAT|nr:unnamed protein product [Protopolystoma xenopodis]